MNICIKETKKYYEKTKCYKRMVDSITYKALNYIFIIPTNSLEDI